MRISQYHKKQGDEVEWYSEGKTYDKSYASSLFSFTDKTNIPSEVICGGSGFNLTTTLSPEIEESDLDYSLYPECDYSILKFSQGCIRKCPFCIVPIKEGKITSLRPKNLNPEGKYIEVTDNNFFANPDWKKSVKYLFRLHQKIYLSQGIDIRILSFSHIMALKALHFFQSNRKQVKFAWDNPKDSLEKPIDNILKYIKPYHLMCYVLIGFWSTPEEDLHRVSYLKERGIVPFVMPYNKKDDYQKAFAIWCNNRRLFFSCSWEEYKEKI